MRSKGPKCTGRGGNGVGDKEAGNFKNDFDCRQWVDTSGTIQLLLPEPNVNYPTIQRGNQECFEIPIGPIFVDSNFYENSAFGVK